MEGGSQSSDVRLYITILFWATNSIDQQNSTIFPIIGPITHSFLN